MAATANAAVSVAQSSSSGSASTSADSGVPVGAPSWPALAAGIAVPAAAKVAAAVGGADSPAGAAVQTSAASVASQASQTGQVARVAPCGVKTIELAGAPAMRGRVVPEPFGVKVDWRVPRGCRNGRQRPARDRSTRPQRRRRGESTSRRERETRRACMANPGIVPPKSGPLDRRQAPDQPLPGDRPRAHGASAVRAVSAASDHPTCARNRHQGCRRVAQRRVKADDAVLVCPQAAAADPPSHRLAGHEPHRPASAVAQHRLAVKGGHRRAGLPRECSATERPARPNQAT